MKRSIYAYWVEEYKGVRVLCLEDLGDGRQMSLTNDIENVIIDVKKEMILKSIPFPSKVIYKDSDDQWDGWSEEKQNFILLFAQDKREAIKLIVER